MLTSPTAIIRARCGSSPESCADQVEHGVGARLRGHLDLRRHLRFGHVVVLEDQPVTLAVVLDEVEERVHRGPHSLPVVGGGAQRLAHPATRRPRSRAQHRPGAAEAADGDAGRRRLAHARALGDLVHSCRYVVATVDETSLAAASSCRLRWSRGDRVPRRPCRSRLRCTAAAVGRFGPRSRVGRSQVRLFTRQYPSNDTRHSATLRSGLPQ